ncbi:PhzF family phenazine biosynthesis protein [Streptomyces sp. KhCrAH-43]|uniref:PhzF family phenazine biosynthesis protein n=1 Tax=unclassified Streptomyces TaxID=2593676 RepID=UPI000376DEEF|nr:MULTISPECIES: PhzF family phenazine biosynthesis isomerase [unclassified Streptomyces]MYS34368.1 PhzF family phenazine biosynthesis isomerase [Streptomyces sp. SID4920]MYX64593.1 PhzF family phenazine biosynthesis isomerase [Streptomyces sp. SID8373]RAJ51123.1 PhzF family phenazine biosynthesis protein [Streptomyces sp. KhCrAH-43]
MDILRYVAFSADPLGGNPAGVVLDAAGIDEATMASTAAEVGYSETAFAVPRVDGALDIRYFSPRTEVPFCGHATIATAVAHAHRHGTGELLLHTQAGPVPVTTSAREDGSIVATLVSVAPRTEMIDDADLAELLAALRWSGADLDPALPPRVAYAGARHPVIAAATRDRLGELAYDMEALGALMARRDWATIALVHRESDTVFHARNPFPPGGVVEDPATGAAAAALGGYLRDLGLVDTPAVLTVHQGVDMGRPSLLTVGVPAEASSGIEVTGTAVPLG